MKKLIALIMIGIMSISLVACSGGQKATSTSNVENVERADTQANDKADTDKTATTEEINQEEEQPEVVDHMALYASILNRYKEAIEQKLDASGLTNAGISYLCEAVYGDAPLENIGYTYKDINGDDVPELFIGAVGEKEIFEMYTVYDGAVVSACQGAERNAYYLGSDNTLINVGSSSAALSAYNVFTLEGINLVFKEGILYDGLTDEQNPWYKADSADYWSANDEACTEAEANAAIASYEALYTDIGYEPISGFVGE